MEDVRPWEKLVDLLEVNQPDQVKEYLESMKTEDIVRSISRLGREKQLRLLTLLSPEDAADLLEEIPDYHAADIMEDMDVEKAAAIFNELDSDDRADLFSEMEEEEAAAILSQMEPEEAESVRRLIKYDPETAGGMMITEFLSFDEHFTVGHVVHQLREHAEEYEDYNLQYLYVTSKGRLKGVLQMRDLLLSTSDTRLNKIVHRDVISVKDTEPLRELISFFHDYNFFGVPVVDLNGALLGVVLRRRVMEAETEYANIELLETQGIVGGEELRTMPVLLRSRRRLSWLTVNILLNVMAASVIALHQDTLSSVIALAVFLPIISDMSGCSGNQAVAVSLRELSLGVIRPFEVVRVWLQEVSVGAINGLVLGLLIGAVAFLWKGSILLSLIVGGALMFNTIVAVSIGGTVPLVLRKFGADPALASGPILTTITDMFGFFLTLTFASLALARYGGI
ncbi:MAG: magnesium transporter [Cyclobacteriaceae bacterium]|nr:magnesium transporter [Cyclobacteriaceae bacterium]